jgi:diacylglycerol kinase
MSIFSSHHPVRHAKSFKYAFTGIFHALLNEANFRVQIVILIFSIILGLHFKITPLEWAVLSLSMGTLLSSELMNTAVEEFIDHLIKEHHEGAKVIKDLSAGFVLVTAITALSIMVIIFGPRLNIF